MIVIALEDVSSILAVSHILTRHRLLRLVIDKIELCNHIALPASDNIV